MPESKERFQGTDASQNNLAKYQIGFEPTSGAFIPLMEMFYDNKLLKYVKHRMGFEVGSNPNQPPQISGRKTWKQGIHPK